jgi:preprotein translocase subunit SecG
LSFCWSVLRPSSAVEATPSRKTTAPSLTEDVRYVTDEFELAFSFRVGEEWTSSLPSERQAFLGIAYGGDSFLIFALAASIPHLGVWRFVLASLAGRGARFFGPSIQRFLENYLGWVTLILGVVLVTIYLASRYFSSRFEKRAREKEQTVRRTKEGRDLF